MYHTIVIIIKYFKTEKILFHFCNFCTRSSISDSMCIADVVVIRNFVFPSISFQKRIKAQRFPTKYNNIVLYNYISIDISRRRKRCNFYNLNVL